jgi:hypothetical protein
MNLISSPLIKSVYEIKDDDAVAAPGTTMTIITETGTPIATESGFKLITEG